MSITKSNLIAKINTANPGRNWDQQCQALMWQAVRAGAGSAPVVYPSAIAAYRASTIVSKNASKALPGDIHYWEIGRYGHDGLELGGGKMLHTSTLATNVEQHGKFFFTGIVSSYRGRYLGFSRANGRNPRIPLAPAFTPVARSTDEVKRVAAYLNGRKLGRTSSSAVDGIPGPVFYWLAQTAGKTDSIYPGTVDGKTGPLTEAAIDYYVAATEPTPEPEPPKPTPDPVEPPVEEPETPVEPEPPAEPPKPGVNIWSLIVTALIAVGVTIWAFLTGP